MYRVKRVERKNSVVYHPCEGLIRFFTILCVPIFPTLNAFNMIHHLIINAYIIFYIKHTILPFFPLNLQYLPTKNEQNRNRTAGKNVLLNATP